MPAPLRQLVTTDEAQCTPQQHTGPCSDCPWARRSLQGWLAGEEPGWWLAVAHGEGRMECHTLVAPDGQSHQCAGAAIYRRNVCKRVEPPTLVLPRDTNHVFSSPSEFAEHHLRRKVFPAELMHMRLQGVDKLNRRDEY